MRIDDYIRHALQKVRCHPPAAAPHHQCSSITISAGSLSTMMVCTTPLAAPHSVFTQPQGVPMASTSRGYHYVDPNSVDQSAMRLIVSLPPTELRMRRSASSMWLMLTGTRAEGPRSAT